MDISGSQFFGGTRRSLLIKTIHLACALLLVSAINGYASETISVGVVNDSAGFFGVSNGKLAGSIAGTYQCVFDHAGIKFHAYAVPLKRGLVELEMGRLDILAPLAKSAARDQNGDFGGYLFRVGVSTVRLQSLAMDEPSTDLPGLRYGTLLGTIGKEFIPESAAAVDEVAAWSQLMEMLKRRRIDVAIMPTTLAERFTAREETLFATWEVGYLPVSFYLSKRLSGSEVKQKLLNAVVQCRGDSASTVRVEG